MRINHDYERGGVVAYMGAYDVPARRCSAAASRPPASTGPPSPCR